MYNELTSDEESVILHKGTEQPFTGIYENHWEDGISKFRGCDPPETPSGLVLPSVFIHIFS